MKALLLRDLRLAFRSGGGFGLGLSSARRMAALMDGEAGFDSRAGRGSAFFLELAAA